jgi:predicted transcriptional regulator
MEYLPDTIHVHLPDTIHVRIPPDLREQLERLADAEDRPLSSLVRRVLKAEAARHTAPNYATAEERAS